MEALPQVRLERRRLVLLEARLHLEEAFQRGIADRGRARRILGDREAREDLEVTARLLERQEACDAQVPGGQEITPPTIVSHSGLQELEPEILLTSCGLAEEKQCQHGGTAPDSTRGSPWPALFQHCSRSPYLISTLRTNKRALETVLRENFSRSGGAEVNSQSGKKNRRHHVGVHRRFPASALFARREQSGTLCQCV